MGETTAVSEAVFVIEGATPSPDGASVALALLGADVGWSVVCVIAEHPRLTSGATGFAGPVLSPDDMESMATADMIAGDAAAAATARGFGDQPVTQSVVRGDLAGAVVRYLDDHPADLVVVDSPELAAPLGEHGIAAVLVVTATTR